MKILACYSIKGGVGKTAAAVNLAHLAAADGARTLLWDLDPQGAASYYFRIRAKPKGGGWTLLHKKRALTERVKGTDYAGLDLLPAELSYRNMDRFLHQGKRPTARLRKRLRPLAGDYDYVFLDCPPGLSLLSENVFAAADALLVPAVPTVLSLRALDQIDAFLAALEPRSRPALLAFFALVDRRKRLHRGIVERLPNERAGLLRAAVPNSSEIERMGEQRRPVTAFAADGAAAQAYRALWLEIKTRLGTTGTRA